MAKTNTINTIGIIRIIGNELPPRDRPNGKLNALKFILENENTTAEVIFVLNRIVDQDYKTKLLLMFEKYKVLDIPIDHNIYCSLNSEDKLNYLTNVNAARNCAIEFGQKLFKYTLILDSPCYFDNSGWAMFTEELESEVTSKNEKKYYAIPSRRMPYLNFPKNFISFIPYGEPMLAFRNDSELRFNEDLRFGSNDKVELLIRLGASPLTAQQHIFSNQLLCKPIGYVIHAATGSLFVEISLGLRLLTREHAMIRLVKRADLLLKTTKHKEIL